MGQSGKTVLLWTKSLLFGFINFFIIYGGLRQTAILRELARLYITQGAEHWRRRQCCRQLCQS